MLVDFIWDKMTDSNSGGQNPNQTWRPKRCEQSLIRSGRQRKERSYWRGNTRAIYNKVECLGLGQLASQLKSGPVWIKRRIKQRKGWGIKNEYTKPTKYLTWICWDG